MRALWQCELSCGALFIGLASNQYNGAAFEFKKEIPVCMFSAKAMISALTCLCLACAVPVFAQDEHEMHMHHPAADEKLGTVSFPISCAPASQQAFNRGVALMHSFQYEDAKAQFVEINKSDPSCAMAHWGIALSYFHQIWERPQEPVLKRGHEQMFTAQKLGAKTERERDYIAALAIFYDNPTSPDYTKRVTAYSNAMGKLYEKYPKDEEAGAFYALSLLASEPPGDTSLANPKKAVAILLPLFRQDPKHPGLAHYIIHSCDNPQMAETGLPAARMYAGIASSSAHAVHMPSHIFARLGLWQEDIQANLKSVALIESQNTGAMYMGGHELHAMHFLLYAYLQTGQDANAKRIVEKAQQIIARAEKNSDDTGMLEYYTYAEAHFPALYDLEMHHWVEGAALQPAKGAPPQDQMITYWTNTISAARIGDVEATRRAAKNFDQAQEEVRKSKYAYMLDGPNLSRGEVQGWLAFAEKRNDDALKQMRTVADTQDKVGKQEVDIPAREMLADMLLELNQPAAALVEYEKSMKIDPNRFNELAGAARAAEMTHQQQKADAYYAQLLKNCDNGKYSDRPALERAKTVTAKNER
jgi:tetratricopeptide (TPR) repeat protein